MVTLTPEEENRISQWNSRLSSDIRPHLLVTAHPTSTDFIEFRDAFSRLAPKIRFVTENSDSQAAPSIVLNGSIHYHAIPLGAELAPFLESLSMIDGGTSETSSPVHHRLQEIKVPAALNVFISGQCPFCPTVVRLLTPLAVESALIRLTVTDCSLFPESTRGLKIRSVPTVLLDDRHRWTGSFPVGELVEALIDRDPANIGPASLESMLKEGHAAQVAEMIVERKKIFPAFLDLLTHEKWPVRLGAMVAMEEIASRDPALAGDVIEPLWERFHEVEDNVKGDIVYILGESGAVELVPRLEAIIQGAYDSEVKEAAEEAREKLKQR